jgi:hypothetical protein
VYQKNYINITLAIVALLFVSLACGSSNEGRVVTQAAPASEQTTVPSSEVAAPEETEPVNESKPSLEVFEVGDLIEVEDHAIRLNGVKYQGTILVANFTIDNLGSDDVSVSSLISFSAKKADGTKLDQEYFDCGDSGLDGSVLPSDKLRGDICWSGADPADGIRIYYEASLFGQGAVVWNAVEGVAEELEANPPTTSQVEVFKVGDLIEGKDHTIRLNSIDYQGTVLVANFSVENIGDSDVDMSSMLSFSAKRNDGTKLEQEYFDCGTSQLDGKVLPGDRLRGSVCWSGAKEDEGIKIYYEADLFGEGADVWETISGVAEPQELADAQLKVDVFEAGDIVQVKEHTIVLNNVTMQGAVLKANITIENQGSSDLEISSILSFHARTRDGSTLEQEYFDCGTSFDGSVIPGDKLTGDICWSGAKADDGIRIYYQSEVFGSGAIVWRVE